MWRGGRQQTGRGFTALLTPPLDWGPHEKRQFWGFRGAHGPRYMGLTATMWAPMGA